MGDRGRRGRSVRDAYFWTQDRVAMTLKTCERGECGGVEVVPREAMGDMRSRNTVNLLAADVRALFEGSALDRAHRRVALKRVQFEIIFGSAGEQDRGEAPHYRHALRLRKIGDALSHPIVVDALREQPLWVLEVAARETDPERQIRAAAQARVDRANARTMRGG